MPDARPGQSGVDRQGQVVAAFGRRVLVEDAAGVRHPCRLAGRRLRVVCGDHVVWREPAGGDEGIVTSVLPRDTELLRPNKQGRVEIIAANVSLLLVVGAPRPTVDPFIIDRYLAAAVFMDIMPAIVFNKVDLIETASRPCGTTVRLGRVSQHRIPCVPDKCQDATGPGRAS